jgi:hypothetical protein
MIPSCLQLQPLFLKRTRELLLEPNARKQVPLGAESAENPQFGNP